MDTDIPETIENCTDSGVEHPKAGARDDVVSPGDGIDSAQLSPVAHYTYIHIRTINDILCSVYIYS